MTTWKEWGSLGGSQASTCSETGSVEKITSRCAAFCTRYQAQFFHLKDSETHRCLWGESNMGSKITVTGSQVSRNWGVSTKGVAWLCKGATVPRLSALCPTPPMTPASFWLGVGDTRRRCLAQGKCWLKFWTALLETPDPDSPHGSHSEGSSHTHTPHLCTLPHSQGLPKSYHIQ